MPDATLTTQQPGQPPQTRPPCRSTGQACPGESQGPPLDGAPELAPGSTRGPASWATVAPLLARWQIALLPQHDHTWDVISGWEPRNRLPLYEARRVPFGELPQAIAAVAARCEQQWTMENA